jgi:tRNA(Ile)-lysidine synthase
MADANDRILIGVSGGADSVCLALVLKELAYDVAIAHVNHGLRGQASDDDEKFTAALATRLGVQFFSRKVALLGGNIEAAGRDARREFFSELATQHDFARIALAHTRTDRVETFFLNLLRGAGSAGLSSMLPVAGALVRPLIESNRDDVESYLKENNVAWRTDASNYDIDLKRNRLRHVLIPQLSKDFNPNLLATLSRTVDILESEDEWMRSLVDEWLHTHGTKDGPDFVLSVEPLHGKPIAMVRRILRAALQAMGSNLNDVSFDHIDAVRGLLQNGKSGKVVQVPGGLQVAREFDSLRVRYSVPRIENYEYELRIPGSVHIPELRQVFRAEIIDSEPRERVGQFVFVDADSIGACVRIRNWKPGDYYKPVGLPAGKLKKLFQRARIPRSHRTSWPVVIADSTIVWVASFPVSREFVPRSQKKVAIEAVHLGDNLL